MTKKMTKKMTDKQLLARIEELDKRAIARYLLKRTNKHLTTEIKEMNPVETYKYLRNNANFFYAGWLSDKENNEYEDVLEEIEKRGLN